MKKQRLLGRKEAKRGASLAAHTSISVTLLFSTNTNGKSQYKCLQRLTGQVQDIGIVKYYFPSVFLDHLP